MKKVPSYKRLLTKKRALRGTTNRKQQDQHITTALRTNQKTIAKGKTLQRE